PGNPSLCLGLCSGSRRRVGALQSPEPRKDMLSYTGEHIFSSTDLLKNNSESLSRPMFAVRTIGKPPGLPTKRSRKARRVLYPARVRKYLPRQEKDLVKRWLLFFAGIILMQVLTEDLEQERLAGEKGLRHHPCCVPASLTAAQLRAGPFCSLSLQMIPFLHPAVFPGAASFSSIDLS
uniref:Radiation-inducible immediate-early gene IEX-1 n=1 Tax=Apteryx owenii TaxID=8824 RepID=A0A8B9PN50_APTOW